MTPDKARALLDGTMPGPWEWVSGKDDGEEYEALRGPDGANALRTQDAEEYASWIDGTNADKALAAAAPGMARMIAGMRPQYRAEYRLADGTWAMYDVEKCDGWTTVHGFARGQAAELARTGAAVRIVRRYVTNEEEA